MKAFAVKVSPPGGGRKPREAFNKQIDAFTKNDLT